jgi:protocatechuate 3,4-dioxygenase beta subunit
VLIRDDGSRPLTGVRVTLRGPVERRTTTVDGTFRFEALPPGRYSVTTEEDPERSLVPSRSPVVAIANSHACRDVSLTMALTSLIEGWVRDRNGVPVPGKPVELRRADQGPWLDPSDALAPMRSATELTSATGRFAFRGVPPGRYFVGTNLDLGQDDGPFAPVYASGPDGRPAVISLALGEHRRLPDLVFPYARARVTGTVVFADGRAAGKISVLASAAVSKERWRVEHIYTSTDEAGHFALSLAPGRPYRLEADDFAGHRIAIDLAPGSRAVSLVLRPRQ